MRLADFMRYSATESPRIDNTNGVNTPSSSQAANQYRIFSEIRNMLPGDIIFGEVISTDGEEIQLLIDNNAVLSAKTDQGMNLTVGQNMTFELNRNSDSMVSLRPLFTNLAQQQTVLQALEEAGIPKDMQNAGIVAKMMNEGMSIDKQSLQNMFREISMHPEAKAEDVITLVKLQIPVTDSNLQQIQNYRNVEHQLTNSMQDISNRLMQSFNECVSQNDYSGAARLYSALLEGLISMSGNENTQTMLMTDQGELRFASNDLQQESEVTAKVLGEELSHNQSENLQADTQISKQSLQTPVNPLEEIRTLAMMFASEDGMQLPEDIKNLLSQKQVNTDEFLNTCLQQLNNSEGNHQEAIVKMMRSEGFSQLLKQKMVNELLLQPSEVEKPENVTELFHRLERQTLNLSTTMSEALPKGNEILNQLSNVSDNLEFMSQLNQTMTYVQLPLKMNGQSATGDLYVYTNKKYLALQDKSISALLHLDMDHIGNLDIHVSMYQKNVSTRFYLENDEILDFIEEHLPMLNERLEKRGYTMTSELNVRNQENSVAEAMFDSAAAKKKATDMNQVLMQYGFDVRA